jgi:hypothetical protein
MVCGKDGLSLAFKGPIQQHHNHGFLRCFQKMLRSVEEEAHLEHHGSVAKIPIDAEFACLVVDKIDVRPWFVNPSHEKVGDDEILVVVPLQVSFDEKVGTEGIDDSAAGDVGSEFPSFHWQIKPVTVEDKFDIQVLGELEEAAGVHPEEVPIKESTVVHLPAHSDVFGPVRLEEADPHVEPVNPLGDEDILTDFKLLRQEFIILDETEKQLAAVLKQVEHARNVISRCELPRIILDIGKIIEDKNLTKTQETGAGTDTGVDFNLPDVRSRNKPHLGIEIITDVGVNQIDNPKITPVGKIQVSGPVFPC